MAGCRPGAARAEGRCGDGSGGGHLFPGLLQAMALRGRYVSVGRNDGPVSEIDLDLMIRNRLRLLGVTFRTRTTEEALQCSERCAADLAGAIHQGTLRPV